MSTMQTMRNVQVSEDSIRRVAEELELNVNKNEDNISVSLKSGAYRELQFTQNSEGNYDIRYDSDRRSDVRKLIDCVIQEEAVTHVQEAVGGRVTSATQYAAFMQGQEELVAEVAY